MLSRLRNIAAKAETTEGTVESLAASNGKTFVYNQKFNTEPELFPRNLDRSTFAKQPHVVGKKPASVSFEFELKGSGSASTAPDWVKFIKACGCGVNALKSINIGSITGGPFVHGETITGGTSAATGRVIKKTTNGASAVLFVLLTGTFQSGEVITGSASGATATTSSTASTVGNAIEPITSGMDSLTIGAYQDAIRKIGKGMRGNTRLMFANSQPVMAACEFMGVESSITDNSFFASVTPETTIPPAFNGATLTIDSVSVKISQLEVNLQNKITMRDDVTDSAGLLSAIITGRDTVATMDPEMVAVASHDFFGKLLAGSLMELSIAWGASSGNRFEFYAPAVQYSKVGDGDRDGIMTADCELNLTGSLIPGNDDFVLITK